MKLISKDAPLEVSLTKMKKIIDDLGYKIKLSKEKNPVKKPDNSGKNSCQSENNCTGNERIF